MKYLLNSTLLVRGVRVSVSLATSDVDYDRLMNDHNAMRNIMQDIGHDLANLLPHKIASEDAHASTVA